MQPLDTQQRHTAAIRLYDRKRSCKPRMTAGLLTLLLVAVFPILANAAPEQAKKADDFVESIGVNAHLDYDTYVGGTGYKDIIRPRLGELGIRHMRGGILPGNQAYFDHVNDLYASFGIKVTAVVQGKNQTEAEWAAGLNPIKKAVIAVEGLNEPDGDWFWGYYGFTKDTWMPETKAVQLRLYNFVKSRPDLRHLAVAGPSLMGSYRGDWQSIGNMEDRVDYGNFHLYQWDRVPSDAMDWWHMPNVRMGYPVKPVVCTESGYPFLCAQNRIGEYAADRYIPRILLENWRFGVTRTFLYEFYDQNKLINGKPDGKYQSFNGNPEEGFFGLVRNDGSVKPCFTTIKNMIALLQEPKAHPFAPGALDLKLTGGDASVHHFLLQKSEGTYYLVIWQDAKDADYATGKQAIVVPEQRVTATLTTAVRRASVYKPMTDGTNAVGTFTNLKSINLFVPDHPLIVAITLKAPSSLLRGGTPHVPAPLNTFHVALNGSDTNPGTRERPLATLEGAREAVRRRIAQGLSADLHVVMHKGTYLLTHTLVFGPADGGTLDHTVTYEAAPGETVVVSGGRRISRWIAADHGQYRTSGVDFDFRQLYINGSRAIRARTPNRTNDATMGPFFRAVSVGKSNLVVKAADLAALKRPEGVEIVMNSHWHHKRLRIESIQVKGELATITPKAPERNADFFGHFVSDHDPFYLENSREFLDAPGEWFLDPQAHTVCYMPRPGENMKTAQVIAPMVETLIRLQGTAAAPVTSLRFQGIRFEHSTWLAPSREGLVDNQSLVEEGGWAWLNGSAGTRPNPGAVEMHNTRAVTFDGCTFQHLGCQGIELFAPTAHDRIIGNRFTDISGDAIVVNPTLERTGTPSDHDSITDNTITRCGQDYTSASGIVATYASFLSVEHNQLSDLPYTGISVGWGWGATPDTGTLHDNSIQFNNIHHVMQCMDDGGGIYTLERQTGTVVNENYIHDIIRSSWDGEYGSSGLYFDNGSSYITATGNVIEDMHDEKFKRIVVQTVGGPAHDITLKDNDTQDTAVKDNAGPRRRPLR